MSHFVFTLLKIDFLLHVISKTSQNLQKIQSRSYLHISGRNKYSFKVTAYRICIFIQVQSVIIQKTALGYKVIGEDEDINKLSKIYKYAIVAVGQIYSPGTRLKLYSLLIESGFNLPYIVSPRAYISRHAIIGKGSIVMHNAVVNANASVGDNCIINTGQ